MVIQHDKTDILIIGAGASGAAVMWDLSKSGFKVVCLEQGSSIQADQYPVNHPNWEELSMNGWNLNPNVRKDSNDYPINTDDTDINPLMFNAVGGSTIH
jgi:choline dehydrogenase-like flavoprotein|tara:strand:+ start:225 stop:521 length:297 start_codon:yes stop_codon:yes gene_type:complete